MERTIAVVNDVKDLSELLHGAIVDQVRFVVSGERLRLDMELTRAMLEQQQVVRHGLFRKVKTPWIKSQLVLDQIQDVQVQRLSDGFSEQTPLLHCEAIPRGYQCVVTAPDGLQLHLTLEQLNGHFRDIGSPIESP